MLQINQSLKRTYEEYWGQLIAALAEIGIHLSATQTQVSNPLFMCVPRDYHLARSKLLIVGQQTGGWGQRLGRDDSNVPWEDPIDGLMNLYSEFNLGEKYYKTPFWRAAHSLHKKLNCSSPPFSFLWSNLLRIDQNTARPDRLIEDVVNNLPNLLLNEIEITQPDIVVFFTGPTYDGLLSSTFSTVSFRPVAGYQTRTLARLAHPLLPYDSFRTYHPNYLSRARKWGIVDDLPALCQQKQP